MAFGRLFLQLPEYETAVGPILLRGGLKRRLDPLGANVRAQCVYPSAGTLCTLYCMGTLQRAFPLASHDRMRYSDTAGHEVFDTGRSERKQVSTSKRGPRSPVIPAKRGPCIALPVDPV